GVVEKEAEQQQQQQQAAAPNSDYFPCAFCGEIFPTHGAYEDHAARQHSRETGARASFECDVCGRSFERYLSFKRHRLHHALIKPFVCGLCARAFTRNHDLQRHRANVHRVRSAPADAPVPPPPPLPPQASRQRRFGTAAAAAAKPGGLFFCDRCGITFDSNAELRLHRTARCRGGPPLPPPNVTFPSESLLSLSLAADCLLGRSIKAEDGVLALRPLKMEVEEEEEEEEGAEEEEEEAESEELACEHCSARFRLETDLVEHRILEHTPLGEPTPQGSPASSSDATGDASCRLPSLPAFPTNPDVGAEASPLEVAPSVAATGEEAGEEMEAEGSRREEGGDG
ncbi:MAG: C2H2-type zinc finger protein, partial [Pseudomonadota bacterium]